MKKILDFFSILLLAIVFIISGCKKPATNPGGSGTGAQLKSMLQIVSSGGQSDSITTTLTYDNQNRLVTQIAVTKYGSNILGADTTTCTYGNGTVVQFSSVTGISVTYLLNSQGYRASDNLGDTWTYNATGYLIQSVKGASGTTTTYAYNSLNQLVTQTAVSNSATNTYTYSYSSNPIGSQGSSWSTGESTGDLFATEVEDQNGVSTTLTATYTLNAQGQLGESIVASSSSPSSPVYTYYTYY